MVVGLKAASPCTSRGRNTRWLACKTQTEEASSTSEWSDCGCCCGCCYCCATSSPLCGSVPAAVTVFAALVFQCGFIFALTCESIVASPSLMYWKPALLPVSPLLLTLLCFFTFLGLFLSHASMCFILPGRSCCLGVYLFAYLHVSARRLAELWRTQPSSCAFSLELKTRVAWQTSATSSRAPLSNNLVAIRPWRVHSWWDLCTTTATCCRHIATGW